MTSKRALEVSSGGPELSSTIGKLGGAVTNGGGGGIPAWDTGQNDSNDPTSDIFGLPPENITDPTFVQDNFTSSIFSVGNLVNSTYLMDNVIEESTQSNMTNLTTQMVDHAFPQTDWTALSLIVVIIFAVTTNLIMVIVVSGNKAVGGAYTVLTSLALADILKALTVMPLSMVKLLIGSQFPVWLCRVWGELYLISAGLTLTHLSVALLHIHCTLSRSSCFAHLSVATRAALQIVLAWLLPLLLSLPYIVYIVLPDTGDNLLSPVGVCSPLHPMLFSTQVFPAVLLPMLLAGFVYVQVVITIGIERRAARTINRGQVSDTSSNGFVTYENSEASISDDELEGMTGKHRNNTCSSHSSSNGYIAGTNVIEHDAIIHDVLSFDADLSDNKIIPDGSNTVSCDNGTETSSSLTTIEPKEKSCHHETEEHDTRQKNGESEPPERPKDMEKECEEGHERRGPTTPSDPGEGDAKARENAGKNKPTTGETTADCAGVNLVIVKTTKVGKEALNVPLEGGTDDDVQLKMASFLSSQAITAAICSGGGLFNPAYTPEDSDMPFCESIKPRTPAKGSNESLTVDDANDNGASRASSFSGDENGQRSILKWDRSKHSSMKSVTFALPPEDEQQQTHSKPRLLSCKYKTKNKSGKKVPAPIQRVNVDVQSDGDITTAPVRILCKAKETLAKTAKFHYVTQYDKDKAEKTRAHIKKNTRLARLLLSLLLLCIACVTPYVATLQVVWFDTNSGAHVVQQPHTLLNVLEWLGFLPYIVYPVLYVACSQEFRRAVTALPKSVVSD